MSWVHPLFWTGGDICHVVHSDGMAAICEQLVPQLAEDLDCAGYTHAAAAVFEELRVAYAEGVKATDGGHGAFVALLGDVVAVTPVNELVRRHCGVEAVRHGHAASQTKSGRRRARCGLHTGHFPSSAIAICPHPL